MALSRVLRSITLSVILWGSGLPETTLEGRVRIFKSKTFTRDAKKFGLADADLLAAVAAAERGLLDADLGGGVVKQRIAREGEGKSGGFRTIILLKSGERAFFVFVFAKNEQENIKKSELTAFKKLATVLLALDDPALTRAMAAGALTEVNEEDEVIK
jgi:hypothetical protein